jgi:ligand-binding sensor domain-containing protein/two-component sensor histidine kinase
MPFKNYGIRDGLNDNNVTAVIKDDRGLLWIGTDFAVSWFDGKRFYQPEIKTNIGQLYVTGFYKDRKGAIWVLTFFNGIYKYQNGHFSNFTVDNKLTGSTNNPVSDMLQISANKYLVIVNNGAYLFDGQNFSLFDSKNDVLKSLVNSAAQLQNRDIVLSTDSGIFIYSYINEKPWFIGQVLKNRQVIKSLVTPGKIWVLTNKGLLDFDASERLSFSKQISCFLAENQIKTITADKNGAIWTFTYNGMWTPTDTVFKIKDGKTSVYLQKNGLPENISQIYCDDEGLIWFANIKGVAMLGDEYYEFNTVKKGGANEPVTSLANDSQNNLLAGTFDGIAIQKNGTYVFDNNIGNPHIGYVSWMQKNNTGALWAGTSAGVLNINNGSVKTAFGIRASAVDTDNNKQTWFGCINGDIWINKGKGLSKMKAARLISEMIMSIHPVQDELWVGYRDRGIFRYKIKKDSLLLTGEISPATGFADVRVRCSSLDKKGNIIWGTRTNGIFIVSIKGNLVTHITTKNGLNANWVRDIYCDQGGKLYLATNNGINIVSGNYKSPSFDHIKINDENINRETNCILNTGQVFYIGTNEGVLKWMPAHLNKDNVAPPVYFTKINIPGLKNFSIDPYNISFGEITMAYDEHFISFEFAGISLKNPESVRYRYILNGQDNEWSPLTDHNDVAYNLKPGDYTFKVSAQNADGVWSERPATFHFTIRPPFWQTLWFVSLVILAGLCTIYGVYRYKLSKLAALESLRDKISADLHDDIGSTLSSISILSEVASTEDEQKSKRMLGEIKERSLMLMEKMDDIVWSISSKNDTVGDLLVRISLFAATLFEARDIEYEVKVPQQIKDLKLDMQRRQHIYLILKEAINNLIKYSNSTAACISADYSGGKLNIEIKDNGVGFDIKTTKPGNGLINMKKRTDEMFGVLVIGSEPGHGTSILLSVEIE